ncbi:hypothetical protein TRIUR3_27150 [Triticum urartu]|uniref:Uncharacterized protein n=1 Tax=Triticum urartu TaxID=4572 RepID=M7YTI4_TRIUA|nr:hypothetical protein TRIUR3_27150 [Triticum urartu]
MTSIEVAVAGGNGKRRWVSDVEKTLNEADKTVEVAQWERHCIYRVPACIKDIKSKAYQPQGGTARPGRRAGHWTPSSPPSRRSRSSWRARTWTSAASGAPASTARAGSDDDRRRLLPARGVMRRTAAGNLKQVDDYAGNDPIFSRHGILYMVPYIKRDMLMLENQLPLLVLQRLDAAETGKSPGTTLPVLQRLDAVETGKSPPGGRLGLHPLDVFRRSMLFGEYQKIRSSEDNTQDNDIIRSAVELYEAGIQFKTSKSSSLHNIRFKHGVLSMPTVPVDDSTEYMFLNMMAFERLHVGAGNDVTAYVFFMDNIIDSAKDVALLSSKGIIQNAVGSDKAVAKLFNSISRDVVLEPDSALDAVQRQVNGYFRQPWNMWRANLIHTYFRSPWAFLSLAAAVFLLVMTIMQTVYTVLPFYNRDSNSPPSAPSPM